jgi:hypothetical protein
MPRHEDPLVSFDIPRDWENKTIIAYAAPPSPGGEIRANLVMTRDRLQAHEDLEDYAERHVDELAKRMRGFALLGSSEAELGGRPAIHVSFSSDTQDGPLVQRLSLVLLPEQQVAAFTLTAPQRDIGQLTPLFDRIMQSVRFASGSSGSGSG